MEKRGINLRIKELIKLENHSISSFERFIEAGNGSIRVLIDKDQNISGALLSKILNAIPNLNANWLITGIGEVYLANYNHNKPIDIVEDPGATYYRPKCKECSINLESLSNAQELLSIYKLKVLDLENRLAKCEKKALQT
jgi:hypothetical protein